MPDTSASSGTTVVGAGIVGICCTLSLLEKGETVTVIDRAGPAEGASGGNAGVISPWSCVPQSMPGLWRSVPKWLMMRDGPVSISWTYLPTLLPWTWKFFQAGRADRVAAIADAMHALNRPNVEIYRHHLAGTGREDLLKESFYIHAQRDASGADLDGFAWRLRARHGAALEVVDGPSLRDIEPALSTDYKAAVLIKDQARALDPGTMGRVLAEKARTMGARFVTASVDHIAPAGDGSWQLRCDRGTMSANTLVVAAGAWSARLMKPLGTDLPLEAERGYHLEFADPGVTLRHSVMDVDAKFVASSMANGLRAAGTAEFAGLDAPANYRRAAMLKRLTKRMVPGLNTAETREWMGTRPSFPDSLPAIGPVPGHCNLFAAFGHSHYGLGMAPATGRIVADLVAGAPNGIDVVPYRLDRFD